MNLTEEIQLKIEEIKNICEEKGIEIHFSDEINFNITIPKEKVKSISAEISGVDVALLSTQNRAKEAVWARWLVFYYFSKTSNLSLVKIGKMCNRDHATVIPALAGVVNPYLNGWRKSNKLKFEAEINKMHESIGLKSAF